MATVACTGSPRTSVPLRVTSTDGSSRRSENAMSETKKSGVASMPATASGALGARRSRCAHRRPASITRWRNSRVRGSRGAEKIWAGGPSSRMYAGIEEADLVGDFPGEAHLVRGDDHRHPLVRECPNESENLADELRVERARDLVEEHQLRVHRERAGDRDALLLAAGEPVRVLVPLVLESDEREKLPRLGVRARLGQLARPDRPERDVLEHGHVREEVVRLKHDPDLAPQGVHVDLRARDDLAVDHDRPGVDRARAG